MLTLFTSRRRPPPPFPLQALSHVAQGHRERGPTAVAKLYALLAASDIFCDIFLSMRVRKGARPRPLALILPACRNLPHLLELCWRDDGHR